MSMHVLLLVPLPFCKVIPFIFLSNLLRITVVVRCLHINQQKLLLPKHFQLFGGVITQAFEAEKLEFV